jgi:hypothetical protein
VWPRWSSWLNVLAARIPIGCKVTHKSTRRNRARQSNQTQAKSSNGRSGRTTSEVNPLEFSPIPQSMTGDLRSGKLLPIDGWVVLEVLRWFGERTSGWLFNAKVAEALDISERTVTR